MLKRGEVSNPNFKRIVTITIANGTATKTEEVVIDGVLTDIYFDCPEIGSLTNELILKDEDDHIIYATGEVADNTSHPIHLQRTLEGTTKVVVETSGDVGEDETYTVTLKGMKLSRG